MPEDRSPWTLDTLKEHFDALRAADKEALDRALVVAGKAVDVLAEQQREYRAFQNEWRGTINDILAQGKGARMGIKEVVAYAVGLVGLALAVATFFLRK